MVGEFLTFSFFCNRFLHHPCLSLYLHSQQGMKQSLSFWSVLLISCMLIGYRLAYTDSDQSLSVKVTTWDALGYYLYLPSSTIYHDDTALQWFRAIDGQYALSGGNFYQAQQHENGHLVFKYLRGVSILQTPWFLLAHGYCVVFKTHPPDGFSAPYQYAVAWGAVFWVIFSLFLLRRILLQFSNDRSTALSLVLLVLATNALQYISIDSAQSHAYIFPLYVLILFYTIRWHATYHLRYAFLMGLIIGLATISRPTEAVMLFIPLLWNSHEKSYWHEKWQRIKAQPTQWLLLMAGGLLGILPQLLYWKRVTGSWIYDVGSKWDFLSPHWRVLFGWEKGWFIYTPVTLLFVAGLFFLKGKAFRSSVITFCLLNIYIIIAWHIWRYGGSYSTRALVQSYPVFALPLAALLDSVLRRKWGFILWPIGLVLLCVNLFQIWQYNRGILHYDDMNRAYYSAIFLNPHPESRHMSLLDTGDFVHDEGDYARHQIFRQTKPKDILSVDTICAVSVSFRPEPVDRLIKVSARTDQDWNRWGSYWVASLLHKQTVLKQKRFRLFHPLCKDGAVNEYVFYLRVPDTLHQATLLLQVDGPGYKARLLDLQVETLEKS